MATECDTSTRSGRAIFLGNIRGWAVNAWKRDDLEASLEPHGGRPSSVARAYEKRAQAAADLLPYPSSCGNLQALIPTASPNSTPRSRRDSHGGAIRGARDGRLGLWGRLIRGHAAAAGSSQCWGLRSRVEAGAADTPALTQAWTWASAPGEQQHPVHSGGQPPPGR